MDNPKIVKFGYVLLKIAKMPSSAWVYLPTNGNWNLDSESVVLESEEVPEENEEKPDAGIPEFAKRNSLKQILPVSTVQDIVDNAKAQKPNSTLEDLYRAFEFYYRHDAFISF